MLLLIFANENPSASGSSNHIQWALAFVGKLLVYMGIIWSAYLKYRFLRLTHN